MIKQRLVTVLLLATAMGACEEGLLDVLPVDEIAEEISIVDASSAQAALMGAYSALQGGSYYGGDYLQWSETLTDNVEHTGTFGEYGDADLVFLRPDVGAITGIWGTIYSGINRVNLLIEKVPAIDGMDPDTRDEILGQAYGLRALHYMNLARAWGGVPLVLVPAANLEEAAQVSRASEADVYAQINADLTQAATLLSGMSNNGDRTFVTPGGVTALQARAALYAGVWATAETRAQEVISTGDYQLVANLRSMFTAEGDPTAEDIFRVSFTGVDWQNLGYMYMFDGRFEIGATQEIYDLFPAGDLRFDLNFAGVRADGIEVVKFPTPIGAEDPHVIRYADILLISAEAKAQQNKLAEAVDQLNLVHERAGLAPYVFGVDLTTQAEVLDAIYLERRLELAFEGEYWFDLCRTGTAAAAIGSQLDAWECLWPIPVSELDVAPNLVQNPGY
jgi:hypothetical protein